MTDQEFYETIKEVDILEPASSITSFFPRMYSYNIHTVLAGIA